MKNELECLSPKSLVNSTELPYIFVTSFDDASVSSFYKSFIDLHSKPEVKVIPIVISSYGGQVYALLAMLDVLKSSKKPIATIGVGKAMSCGSVLIAAGTKGYRYSGEDSEIMIHQVSSLAYGKTTEVMADAKNNTRLNNILFSKLDEYSGKTKGFFAKKIKDQTNVDWYVSAKEAKKLGLIDNIGIPLLVQK